MHPRPAFPFHDRCWKLLQRMLHPRPVPVERLYDLCLSCPASRRGGWLDWGHDYGRLMDRQPRAGRYPWEEEDLGVSVVQRRDGDGDGDAESPLTSVRSDPFHVPEIQRAVEETVERRGARTMSFASISPVCQAEPDCFGRLPPEIREAIRILLPSASVASLRMASRSFASLPLNQAFWASRFGAAHERAFVFEARDPERNTLAETRTRDWGALYRKTSSSSSSRDASSKAMRNRKRIWDATRELADLLLEERLIDPRREESPRCFYDGDPLQDTDAWRSVGGDIRPRDGPPSPSGMPCRSIWEQTVSVPTTLRRIAVSTRTFSGRRYIAGLRLVSERDPDTLVGYVLPGQETYIDIGPGPHGEGEGDGGQLNGFVLAVGPRGIQALRTTTTAGHVSPWAGSPEGLPTTLRLCMKKPISRLKATFDGLKIVSLAVPADSEPLFPDDPDPRGAPHHLPLRTKGLWYPSIPASHLHLHDDSFAGRDVSLRDYRPLVHVMFGGPRGRYLPSLTQIAVTLSPDAIVGIDFVYTGVDDDDDAPPSNRLRAFFHSPARAADGSVVQTSFAIDGPGGERLTALQAGGDFFLSAAGKESYRYGVVTSLKVTTNRNRTFTFQPRRAPILKPPPGAYVRQKPRTTEIAPGTTITGVYFMHDPHFGMISIGPISEALDLMNTDTDGYDCGDADADVDPIADEITRRIRNPC
ncbi:hypothetical protein VTN02DRAFT_5725 [Thermoascus thermophilus]